MLGVFGLALLGGPFVTLPSPAYGGDPTLIAIAGDPAQMRLPCYSIRCGDEEWRLALGTPENARLAVPESRKPGVQLPGSQRYIGLSAPAVSRESRSNYSNDWRIGTRYDVQALRDGPTQLGLQLGAGYRLAPLYDDGVAEAGPIFRGAVDFDRRFGERAQWNHRIEFETGRRGDTFVKQSAAFDVNLWQDWTLETDFTIRHDSRSGSGSETAESSIELRRRF
ncbi:DUF481 domain-containing protein [Lysobacter niastensis]|uniref:DUF481 domain-containing protein n=1 Tax=Lysobacter niastensis TaxID=380629 RepID=A0ABS0B857_9GAMM|nr:DUF481 domain-containing protein [Lysobacter niastensis]MBF6025196.1 DUF481 domain-containing protein [Lysobacter niastensis]